MARYYLDSSALVKRYHREAGSDSVAALFNQSDNRLFVSRLALVEVHSSFARLVREQILTYKIHTQSPLGESYTAVNYADWIKPTSAVPLARYDQEYLKEFAAVTRNEHGEGVGWYVGTIASEPEFYDKLVAQLLSDAKIRPLVQPPAGVEATVRRDGNRGLLFLINHTTDEKSVAVPPGKRDLLTDNPTVKTLTLAPFGVAILELSAADL